MLPLWQVGLCMSPSSLREATEHPPAQTGMNAQSPQLFQAASDSKSAAVRTCRSSSSPLMWPVAEVVSPAKPGQAYSAPSVPTV